MDKVVFQTNVPLTMALKYAKGKPVTSQIDGSEQVMFTTTENRVMFLYAAAAEKITALNLKPRELFSLCKREVQDGNGGRPRIEWQVERITSSEQPGNLTSPAAPSQPIRNTLASNGHTTSTQNTPPTQLPIDQAMTLFLLTAGRSTREAEKVLGAEGGSVRFDNRDVAALATTLLIQAAREGWITWFAPPQPQPAPELVLPVGTKEAAQAVATEKIANLQQAAATSEPDLTKRDERYRAFAELRELVGEVRYDQELKLVGVKNQAEIRYLNDARAFYRRLRALVQLDREVA